MSTVLQLVQQVLANQATIQAQMASDLATLQTELAAIKAVLDHVSQAVSSGDTLELLLGDPRMLTRKLKGATIVNFQLQDIQKVPYTLVEIDADGNATQATPGDTITVISSDPNMATVVPDATPASGSVASGFIVAGKKIGTVTITASISHADGSPAPPPVSDQIDIVSGPPVSAGFTLGTPVNQ